MMLGNFPSFLNNNYGPVNNNSFMNPYMNTGGLMNNVPFPPNNNYGPVNNNSFMPHNPYNNYTNNNYTNNNYRPMNNNPYASGFVNSSYGFNSKSSGSIPYSQTQNKLNFIPKFQSGNKDGINDNGKLISVQELNQKESQMKFDQSMKTAVKQFVYYVYGLNNATGKKDYNIGIFKLNSKINNNIEISKQDSTDFNNAAFYLCAILFSKESKQKAIECFKELGPETSQGISLDRAIDSFLDFYNSINQDAKKIIFQHIGNNNFEKNLLPNNNSTAFNADLQQTYPVIQSTLINTKNNQNDNGKADQLVKEYDKFVKFGSRYKEFSLSQLDQYLVKMEKWLTNAAELDDFVGNENSRCSELFQNMFDHYVKVNQYFTKVAKSDTDKLLVANNDLCTSFNNQINDIEERFKQFENNNNIDNGIGGKNAEDEKKKIDKYKAEISFRKQQINLNIKGDSIASGMVVGECNAIVGKIEENLKSIETCKKLNQKASCFKNQKNQIILGDKNGNIGGNRLAISNMKQCRNHISSTITNQNNFRECQSVKLIQELKTVDSYLEQKTNKEKLDQLNSLKKSVEAKHNLTTGIKWCVYRVKSWFTFTKKNQITPKNSLTSPIETVVQQRFSEFSKKEFMLPFNKLIIRSLGIDPDLENFETERLFEGVFQNILKPMLENDMQKQVGSLADALFNVIPQSNEKSFDGVKFAICQYVGNAMMQCWVKTVFDFIRRDSSKAYGVTRMNEFNADVYFDGSGNFEGLNKDKKRQKDFKQILSDEFLKCRQEIVTTVENAIKTGKNDHEICEKMLECNSQLLGFCDQLLDYNRDKLDKTTKDRIIAMNKNNIQKQTYSSLVQTLKKNISSCQCKSKIKDMNEEAFLNNLSPSSQKAYEQNKIMVQESVNAPKLQGKKENAKKINNDSLINTTFNNKEEDQYKLKEIDINKYMSKVDKATDLPSAYHGEINTDPVPKAVNKPEIKTKQIIN